MTEGLQGKQSSRALLEPYDLRDAHHPERPFVGEPVCGPGWHGILMELIEDLIRLGWDRRVVAIKEKCGSLRFQITQRDDAILDRIDAAFQRSHETCEECGAPGTWLDENGWMSTLCEPCRTSRRSRGA